MGAAACNGCCKIYEAEVSEEDKINGKDTTLTEDAINERARHMHDFLSRQSNLKPGTYAFTLESVKWSTSVQRKFAKSNMPKPAYEWTFRICLPSLHEMVGGTTIQKLKVYSDSDVKEWFPQPHIKPSFRVDVGDTRALVMAAYEIEATKEMSRLNRNMPVKHISEVDEEGEEGEAEGEAAASP